MLLCNQLNSPQEMDTCIDYNGAVCKLLSRNKSYISLLGLKCTKDLQD